MLNRPTTVKSVARVLPEGGVLLRVHSSSRRAGACGTRFDSHDDDRHLVSDIVLKNNNGRNDNFYCDGLFYASPQEKYSK